MIAFKLLVLAAYAAQASPCQPAGDAERCADIAKPGTAFGEQFSIINATYVPAASLNISGSFNQFPFCRVYAQVPYPENNTVGFEVWLPEPKSYNGNFLAVGNGGFAGNVEQSALMFNMNMGFAVAGGDSGHLGSQNNNGQGAPGVYIPYLHDENQVSAWIHNSIALFTPPAKAVVEHLYSTAPVYTYYVGCSTGGAQGFALAQFHPTLFDGIVAGCPGNWYSHLSLSFLWNAISSTSPYFLPQETLDYITSSVVKACDELDGVLDGIIEDPLVCKFDFESLSCAADNTSGCLTTEQMVALRRFYDGPHDSRDNSSLYPGFSFGSESEWMLQQEELANAFTIPILQNLVFDNLSYDATAFNWGSDVDVLDKKAGTFIDEISPDLSAFRANGGKMIVTQGWADPFNAAVWPIQHFQQIEAAMGGNIDDWFELYMVPGGGHCGAAQGYPQAPAILSSLDALTGWVEAGNRPVEMLSSAPADGSNRTRKLCPYPKTSHYTEGDSDDWASFVCA
ncbi:uncharacterized protein JN550_006942 [Neoarthrinium moseri]|uniref:uncharacterized protein n=1 Tax=Neoarthrinium moseri TaxID=1658444 RepID=UPI001FDB2EA6|nr:uncharacterized protein JN550_006942 [Neoarthrinium moseri]KAI1867801.1 hypothetical protein JN550_006942 [Neoarthrinium moseri]